MTEDLLKVSTKKKNAALAQGSEMDNKNKLSLIKEIVEKLLELEDPNSKERINVLEGNNQIMDGDNDVTDSYLVGHYMGRIRDINEIFKEAE